MTQETTADKTSKTSKRNASYGLSVVVGLIFAIAIILLFRWAASEVFEGETVAFDNAVRDSVHSWATPLLTKIFVIASLVGSPGFLVPLGAAIGAIYLWYGRRRAAIVFAITMAGEILLNFALKDFYARPRPQPFFDYTLPMSFSFPSGHAFGSFCFYGITAYLLTLREPSAVIRWSYRTSAALLILLIGLSRIYLGVHYPTDIVAGYAAASFWLATVISADAMQRRRSTKRPSAEQ